MCWDLTDRFQLQGSGDLEEAHKLGNMVWESIPHVEITNGTYFATIRKQITLSIFNQVMES